MLQLCWLVKITMCSCASLFLQPVYALKINMICVYLYMDRVHGRWLFIIDLKVDVYISNSLLLALCLLLVPHTLLGRIQYLHIQNCVMFNSNSVTLIPSFTSSIVRIRHVSYSITCLPWFIIQCYCTSI